MDANTVNIKPEVMKMNLVLYALIIIQINLRMMVQGGYLPMQIMINISEDTYKATCNGCMLPPDVENVVNAIKNGKIISKDMENNNNDIDT
jgi:hypothetical protein